MQIDHADPPEHLSPVAVELWSELMPELTSCGMLTQNDLLAFGQLCEAYGDWVMARESLAQNGGNYYREEKFNRDGVPIGFGPWRLHPAYYALSDADRRLRGWCQEFALSPSARLRLMSRAPARPGDLPKPRDEEDESDLDLSSLSVEQREAVRTLAERQMVAEQEAREEG